MASNLDMRYSQTSEDIRENGPASSVHGIDGELEARFRDEVEVGEALNGVEIGGQEVVLLDGRRFGGFRDRCAEERFNFRDDGGFAGAAVSSLVLDAVPLRGVVRGSDHDAAGSAQAAHAVAQRRG